MHLLTVCLSYLQVPSWLSNRRSASTVPPCLQTTRPKSSMEVRKGAEPRRTTVYVASQIIAEVVEMDVIIVHRGLSQCRATSGRSWPLWVCCRRVVQTRLYRLWFTQTLASRAGVLIRSVRPRTSLTHNPCCVCRLRLCFKKFLKSAAPAPERSSCYFGLFDTVPNVRTPLTYTSLPQESVLSWPDLVRSFDHPS